MIRFISVLFFLTFSFLKADDQVLIDKIKLLGSDDSKVRIKAKEEILKECYKYTYLLKQNLSNSELEIKESCKEILTKYYNYHLEGMQGMLLPLASKEKSTSEFDKFCKTWWLKKFNTNYQKFGHKSPLWDPLIENFFDKVSDIYIDKNDNLKEVLELAKKIMDLGCQDPFVTYIYGNFNFRLGLSKLAFENLKLSEKQFEIYKYESVFKYLLFNKLLLTSVSVDEKTNYAKKALTEINIFFDQAKDEDNRVLCKLAFEFQESLYFSSVFYKFFKDEKFLNSSNYYKFFYNFYIVTCTSMKDESFSSLLEFGQSLHKKYPEIIEIPLTIGIGCFACEEFEDGRTWFYKAIEIHPDNKKVLGILQGSIISREFDGNEAILFGLECLCSNLLKGNNDHFVIAVWQNVCNKSYYNGCRWDLAFKDPLTYEMIKYGLDITLKNNPIPSNKLKSLKGIYAWLGDDIKTAIAEVPNYKNVPFFYDYQCYVSKEDVLADIYPLLMIKDDTLVNFREQVQAERFAIKRMNLFLNAWQLHPSVKDRFYLSRLFPYLNFTEDSAVNTQIFNLMLEYGRNELIIKKYLDYKNAKNNSPSKMEELIKNNFGELFNIFFEITNNVKFNSVEDLEALKKKVISVADELGVKNKDKAFLYKKEATRAYLREVHEYSLCHFKNEIDDKCIFNGIYGANFVEFYETRRPQLHLNVKDVSSFNNMSGCLYDFYLSRNGVSDQIEWQKISASIFKDESEAFTYVKKIYSDGYSLRYKFQLGILLKKQGFNEIAEYVLIDTYSYYLQMICFQENFNFTDLNNLMPIKGLEDYTCDLIEFLDKKSKNSSVIDELKLFFCLVNNKRYEYALLRSSTFELDRKNRYFDSSYEYDSILYKTIDFINLLRKKLIEEKQIDDSVREKLLKTLDKFEELQVKVKK